MASKHETKPWYIAAIGGVVGLAGLAVLTHADTVASRNRHATTPAATAGQGPRPAADSEKGEPRPMTGEAPASRYDLVVDVPCDPDALIQAILRTNQGDDRRLELARDCTYVLSRGQPNEYGQLDGLPVILKPITIDGNGATIQAASRTGTTPFRIFHVGTGGHLTLENLRVEHGVGSGRPTVRRDVLVQPGGRTLVSDGSAARSERGRLPERADLNS